MPKPKRLQINDTGPAFIESMAVPLEDAPAISGLSRTHIYEAIRDGRMTARKVGTSTLIETSELRRYVRSLPYKGRKPDEADTADAA